MLSKIAIVLALLVLLMQFAVAATPPACVIRAVGESNQSPTNIKDICGSGSTVEQTLVSDCGNDLDAAMSAFSSICARAGVTISTATGVSSTAVGPSVEPSSAMTTDIKSKSASTTATASPSSTESATQSAGVTVTTATSTNTHTDAVISTQTSSQSSSESAAATSSGAPSTGAADHVEMGGLAMSVMIAAGIMLIL
ncbi:hypothetical protein E4T47_00757 [Aureobasidium subglaciale]|nr:hypothetical protein E4T43_01397 [Aureobasidium subglaciale]KAI5276333.1 hypothetical protein E4T47_00757 [Aureobasidium subglaciale]